MSEVNRAFIILNILTCDFLTNLPADFRIVNSLAKRWNPSKCEIVLTAFRKLISEHLGACGFIYIQITINARMSSANKWLLLRCCVTKLLPDDVSFENINKWRKSEINILNVCVWEPVVLGVPCQSKRTSDNCWQVHVRAMFYIRVEYLQRKQIWLLKKLSQ